MKRFEKLLKKLFNKDSEKNYIFADMAWLLEEMGFTYRIKGSHYIFSRQGLKEIINLQPKGKLVKVYQVKQVREIIRKCNLMVRLLR